MKFFMILAAAMLIAGGIYHTEVARYFAEATQGASSSGSATSVVNSIQGMGNSGNALMGGVGNALNR